MINRKEYNQEYYKNNKEKIKEKVKDWQEKNLDKVKNYKKKYENSDKNRIGNKKWIEENPEKNRQMKNQWSKDYRKENKEIINAQKMAKLKIPLKEKCEMLRCGSTKNLQRHHWRYDKPLMVNTLCSTCHKIQHIKHFDSSIYRGGNQFG